MEEEEDKEIGSSQCVPGTPGFIIVLESLKEVSVCSTVLCFPQMHLSTTF